MDNRFFEKPVINSPYDYPSQHWELDDQGQPTLRIIEKRRSTKFITPIPKPRKHKVQVQHEIVFDEGKGLSTREQAYDDEVHHCYRQKPGEDDLSILKGDEKAEAQKNNEAARLWISGLDAVNRKLGIKRALDAWPEIDFTDDREGCQFTVTVHRKKAESSVTGNGSPKGSPKTEGRIIEFIKLDGSITTERMGQHSHPGRAAGKLTVAVLNGLPSQIA